MGVLKRFPLDRTWDRTTYRRQMAHGHQLIKCIFCDDNSFLILCGLICEFSEQIFQALSAEKDGLLITELDLNLCRQVKDHWDFQMTQRLSEYGRDFTNAADPNFIPQTIKEK